MEPVLRLARSFSILAGVGAVILVACVTVGAVLHDANGLGIAIAGVLVGVLLTVVGLGVSRQARRTSERIRRSRSRRSEGFRRPE